MRLGSARVRALPRCHQREKPLSSLVLVGSMQRGAGATSPPYRATIAHLFGRPIDATDVRQCRGRWPTQPDATLAVSCADGPSSSVERVVEAHRTALSNARPARPSVVRLDDNAADLLSAAVVCLERPCDVRSAVRHACGAPLCTTGRAGRGAGRDLDPQFSSSAGDARIGREDLGEGQCTACRTVTA